MQNMTLMTICTAVDSCTPTDQHCI